LWKVLRGKEKEWRVNPFSDTLERKRKRGSLIGKRRKNPRLYNKSP